MQASHALRFLLGVFLSSSLYANAAEIRGRVVGVSDGDTITVLDQANRQHKIRLAGIDAPEKAQAFGNKSKQSLSDMVYDREVNVLWDKEDRYKRVVGKVMINSVDVNLQQLNKGLAWHYKKYQDEQSAVDREQYADAEANARRSRVGLWVEPNAIAPWDWRKLKKSER
jgi:endonuclease YncB( thermonuclease family)